MPEPTERYATALLAAGLGWLLVGAATCLVGLRVGTAPSERAGLVGSDLAASVINESPRGVLVAVGLLIWVLGAALVVGGQGWSLYPLVLLGLALTVGFALMSNVSTFFVMGGLVLGTVPLAGGTAYDFITGKRQP